MTWIALLLYLLLSLILGKIAGRGKKSSDEFWTAGRSLNALSVGLSISAGFMSISWSCVYAVQLFYWYGLGAIWLVTIPWLIALYGIYKLSGKYHGLGSFSQPEMVEKRFGKGVKRIIAIALASVFLVWGAAEIFVASSLLAPDLGIDVTALIVILGIVIAVYTASGGFKAVILTDKMQYILVALYITVVGVIAYRGLVTGGITPFSLTPLTGMKSGTYWTDLFAPGLSLIVITFFAYLPGWIFETDLWLRVQAAKDSRSAGRGILIAGLNGFIFVGILPLFIGIASLYLFPASGSDLPVAVGKEGEAIFAAIMAKYAPQWLRFVSSIGLIAAAMSTIDTCVNIVALSIGYDLLEVNRREKSLGKSKIITVASVILTVLFAMGIESLWDIFYLSSGILTTTVAFPVAAIFIRRVKKYPVLFSSLFGFAGTIIFYFLEKSPLFASFEPDFIRSSTTGFILFGIFSAILGYFAGSVFHKKRT